MNIQIFGTKKCFDTKKAERWFKERRIKYQYIDLKEKGLCAEPGRTGSARYYVTDRTPGFERLARRFLDAGDGEVIDIHLADVVN